MKKKLVVLIAALLAAMIFVACTPESKDPDVSFSELKGSWRIKNGTDVIYLYFHESTGPSSVAYMADLTEKKNGESDSERKEMDVSISGNTITFSKDGVEYKYKAVVKDYTLTLTQSGNKSFLQKFTEKTLKFSAVG